MNNLLCLIKGHSVYNDERSPEKPCKSHRHIIGGGLCKCIDCGEEFCFLCDGNDNVRFID